MHFYSEQERQQHPKASLIPVEIWDKFFSSHYAANFLYELGEMDLELMQTPSHALMEKIAASNFINSTRKQKQATWFAIAYSHPDLSSVVLLDLTQRLNLTSYERFDVAVYFGQLELFELLTDTFPLNLLNEVRAHDYGVFDIAIMQGNLDILNRLFAILNACPDEVEEQINRAFSNGATYRHMSIITRLLDLVPESVVAMIENDDFWMFRITADYGHLPILERLMNLAPDQVHAMIEARDFCAFCWAAENGHLPVIDRLIELAPDVTKMMKKASFLAFCNAAENGYLSVIDRLFELEPNVLAKMIAGNSFSAFREAAVNGHLPVIDRLIERVPEHQKVAMIAAHKFDIFSNVAGNGHLSVLNRLFELEPKKIAKRIAADDFSAFRKAAENGHLLVINRLVDLAPELIAEMIAADDFSAFRKAAENGHLLIINRLVDLAPELIAEMIAADDCYAFRKAAEKGCLSVVDRLVKLAPKLVTKMIAADNFSAFREAAADGHMPIINRLFALTEAEPAQAASMIAADHFEAFQLAASRGHLSVIDRLIELAPTQVNAMIEEYEFRAFCRAVENGHLSVINRLLELAPDQEEMADATYYSEAFYEAATNGHASVINRLLSFPGVLAFAEPHQHEYSEYVQPFIQEKLITIRNERAEFEQTHPEAVFNIQDENSEYMCFLMIKNLIRRNDMTLLDDIRFLLDIPLVKEGIHLRNNELVRLALTTGNAAAAALLLTIPAVYALAAEEEFYWYEEQGQLDLSALAQDRESSMMGLTTGEQSRLQAVIERYEPSMTGKIADVMNELHATLTARYNANPAQMIRDNGQRMDLPKNWDDFNSDVLTVAERMRALRHYYQHKDHTAFRYLSKPNPWMADNASYVNEESYTHARWSTFDEYQPLILMMYLAAIDASCVPVDGYTLETRLDGFIDELAHIGRAHNWDATRERVDMFGNKVLDVNGHPVPEEYDDLQGDKPSCFSGVKRRLFQSVKGHPLLKLLTLDDIKQELREFMREHFKQLITAHNQDELRRAWTKLCEDGIIEPCWTMLDVTPAVQEAFSQSMAKKYLTSFTNDATFINYIKDRFSLNKHFSAHVAGFAGETDLGALLFADIDFESAREDTRHFGQSST